MTTRTPSTPCPHCGISYAPGAMTRHARVCLSSPAVLASVRAALEDPANPGHAAFESVYNVTAIRHGAPGYSYLRKQWGSVLDICRRAGLQPPIGHIPNAAAGQARPCRHCGGSYDGRVIDMHESRCIASPPIRNATLAVMADELEPGYAVSPLVYKARQPGTAAAPYHTLKYLFGCWADTCAALGLTCPRTSQTMAARHAIIVSEDLRTVAQIVARFGITTVTARNDLYSVYGALPPRPRKPKPPKPLPTIPSLGGEVVHVNVRMLKAHRQQLETLAEERKCTLSKIVRAALQRYIESEASA